MQIIYVTAIFQQTCVFVDFIKEIDFFLFLCSQKAEEILRGFIFKILLCLNVYKPTMLKEKKRFLRMVAVFFLMSNLKTYKNKKVINEIEFFENLQPNT